jgi:hypothetical protein
MIDMGTGANAMMVPVLFHAWALQSRDGDYSSKGFGSHWFNFL